MQLAFESILLACVWSASLSAEISCEGSACPKENDEDQSTLLQVSRGEEGGLESNAPKWSGHLPFSGKPLKKLLDKPHLALTEGTQKHAPAESALLVIDMQNDFVAPSGNLAVTDALDIIPVINDLTAMRGWALKAFTQDYHPYNHISFAQSTASINGDASSVMLSYTENSSLCGDEYEDLYGTTARPCVDVAEDSKVTFEQTLWPVHCVQGTWGHKIHDFVDVPKEAVIAKKGFSAHIDSYGAFLNNWGFNGGQGSDGLESNLDPLMNMAGVKTIYVVGVALDFCVKYTSLQAAQLGYEVYVVLDAVKAVNLSPLDGKVAIKDLKQAGVKFINSDQIR